MNKHPDHWLPKFLDTSRPDVSIDRNFFIYDPQRCKASFKTTIGPNHIYITRIYGLKLFITKGRRRPYRQTTGNTQNTEVVAETLRRAIRLMHHETSEKATMYLLKQGPQLLFSALIMSMCKETVMHKGLRVVAWLMLARDKYRLTQRDGDSILGIVKDITRTKRAWRKRAVFPRFFERRKLAKHRQSNLLLALYYCKMIPTNSEFTGYLDEAMTYIYKKQDFKPMSLKHKNESMAFVHDRDLPLHLTQEVITTRLYPSIRSTVAENTHYSPERIEELVRRVDINHNPRIQQTVLSRERTLQKKIEWGLIAQTIRPLQRTILQNLNIFQ